MSRSSLGTFALVFAVGFGAGIAVLRIPQTRPVVANVINLESSGAPLQTTSDPAQAVDFANFWQAWQLLDQHFSPLSTTTNVKLSTQERVNGAIDGLVKSYHDPYTIFFPKAQADSFKDTVNGEFDGIGAVLAELQAGGILVQATLKQNPAEAAGVLPGDRIMAVDGTSVLNMKLPDVVSHIRGPKGSVVTLSILRGKSLKENTIAVTRGTIVIPTTAARVVSRVETVMKTISKAAQTAAAAITPGGVPAATAAPEEAVKENHNYFVVQLSTFAKSSTDAFVAELKKFASSGSRDLIIDLRNNPGGYLDVAVEMASYFLPKDAPVVREFSGVNAIERVHPSFGYGILSTTTVPHVVVLINRNSASASEILAGALQDHGVGKLVGEKSYGKGSVQTLVDIGEIGSIKITIARWFTPAGHTISGTGLTPDITVDMKKYASSSDAYIDAAIDALKDPSQWPDTATSTATTTK